MPYTEQEILNAIRPGDKFEVMVMQGPIFDTIEVVSVEGTEITAICDMLGGKPETHTFRASSLYWKKDSDFARRLLQGGQ